MQNVWNLKDGEICLILLFDFNGCCVLYSTLSFVILFHNSDFFSPFPFICAQFENFLLKMQKVLCKDM